jgi:hypothetical protein
MPSTRLSFLRSLLFPAIAGLCALTLAGCTPSIGDHCNLSTDCSLTGNLQCDTSMPGGYCTIFNCGPNTCPNGNACYLFHANVQGCPYSDREPSRTGHSFCMKDCKSTSDCRSGYECADLRRAPWSAVLLDDNQNQSVCVPIDDSAFVGAGATPFDPDAAPAICQASPDVDAAFPADADGVAQEDAGGDGGGTEDAAADASDAALVEAGVDAEADAALDAADAASDAAPLDAADQDGSDAGPHDATID